MPSQFKEDMADLSLVLDERTKNIESLLKDFIVRSERKQYDLDERVMCLEVEQGKIKERQTILQAAQATWTIIVGTVAAYLGGTR